MNDFELIKCIGRGSYAKVLLVKLKATGMLYAMKIIKKELLKEEVSEEDDVDWVQTEKNVFETASNHPFLVGLHSCFQVSTFQQILPNLSTTSFYSLHHVSFLSLNMSMVAI